MSLPTSATSVISISAGMWGNETMPVSYVEGRGGLDRVRLVIEVMVVFQDVQASPAVRHHDADFDVVYGVAVLSVGRSSPSSHPDRGSP